MLFIFNLRNFGILSHCERVIDNFKVSLTISIDLDEFLALEVVVLTLITD